MGFNFRIKRFANDANYFSYVLLMTLVSCCRVSDIFI